MSTCWWDEHVNNLYPVKINHHPTTEMKNKQEQKLLNFNFRIKCIF